ncbi:ATP-binding protein [Reichenbachiella versicolor]|uniref:ATP-binding protein n=1 Tax=Reichenbachiella versicolor TaxID=1821036 RepID=UPI000D6E5FD9|nr:ATP-binding protein [Reichenbachiella versicolor]
MYLIALASIVLTIIVSQILIQSFIKKQSFDSRVINVAGKQRMLSQKICKIALKIKIDPTNHNLYQELSATTDLWKLSHVALQEGSDTLGVSGINSAEVLSLFANVEPYFSEILKNSEAILSTSTQDTTHLHKYVDSIISVEESFLQGMDAIVYQYDQEAKSKVQILSKLEFILFAVAILIIVFEFLFLFRPTSRRVVATFNDLVKSEEAAKKMTAEVNKLYTELGKSYQDLESVNIEADEPSILLKCNSQGKVEFISERFKEIMSIEAPDFESNLYKWLGKEGYNEDFLTKLENIVDLGESWSGELNVTDGDGDLIWLDMYFQPVPSNGKGQKPKVLAIGRDITEVKEAKQRSREINREAIEKRVKEQQYRSVLILEGQEEERKRISAEIHDGIGQLLTGLKLNLEGITPTDAPHMKKRIKDTKELMKSVIKEVRRVSFNLAPSSLVDFGITPALKKISQEVTALTNTTVLFENRTGFINRLDKIVETNLYRIVQEAVNNSIKYSEGTEIKISVAHAYNQLTVIVEDNGKGFEKERLEKAGHFGASGHGIFNMKERAAYINAQFDVTTELNKGTKITISLPLS